MTGFTEQLAADLAEVFLNLDEFGETITLDGQPMPAVVEEFAVDFGLESQARPGVSLEGVALQVRESDAPGAGGPAASRAWAVCRSVSARATRSGRDRAEGASVRGWDIRHSIGFSIGIWR